MFVNLNIELEISNLLLKMSITIRKLNDKMKKKSL